MDLLQSQNRNGNPDDSPAPPTPYSSIATPRSAREGSPVGDFEPFENEAEILGEIGTADEDESEGEDLFGGNMERYPNISKRFRSTKLIDLIIMWILTNKYF